MKNCIVLKPDRLSVFSDNGYERYIKWQDVYVASFHQIDGITSIITYLVFDFDYGEYIEVYDEQEGFDDLVNGLGDYLKLQIPDLTAALRAATLADGSVVIYQRD